MSFQKSFDDLYEAIITDYKNQAGKVTIEVQLRAACLASALWGVYYAIERASRQVFPDTADTDSLNHHGSIRALSRNPGETDAAYLERLLANIRKPPAGGNKNDYIQWARSISNVANAFALPLAQGDGTVDVVVVADLTVTGSELPSSSARIGKNTSVSAGKLVDSGAAFDSGLAVQVGDVVENPADGTETTVQSVVSGTQLALADDIFKYVGESYIVHSHTGTNTAVTEDKLIDSAAAFNDATYTIKKGDPVENLDDDTETTVLSVDSASQLTIADDIFTEAGQRYLVRGTIARVKKHIDESRPVTASRVDVKPPTILNQNVTIGVSGAAADKAKIALDITAYLDSLEPGQTLYITQLVAIAIQNGALNAAVSVPAADVVPGAYQMIRHGTITVT